MRCVTCGHDKMARELVEETIRVGDVTFTARVPADVCPRCGEFYLDGVTIRALEKAVAEALAHGGDGSPEAFRYMRKAIGLKAVEVAELMSVTPETVSRWENGERQPEPRAVRLLGALVLEVVEGRTTLLEYLRSLGRDTGPRPAKRRITTPLQMSLDPR